MMKKRGELTDRQKANLAELQTKTAVHQAMLTSTLKGFAVLNGAGVVTMLGFIQALLGKSSFLAFKPYAMIALILFMIGALAATIAYLPMSSYLRGLDADSNRESMAKFLLAAICCSLLGAVSCAMGIAFAL